MELRVRLDGRETAVHKRALNKCVWGPLGNLQFLVLVLAHCL